jgi:hypothetical protein
MLAVYMERSDYAQPRALYQVDIQPTLFEDWAVICHWGPIGTYGRMQQDSTKAGGPRKWHVQVAVIAIRVSAGDQYTNRRAN